MAKKVGTITINGRTVGTITFANRSIGTITFTDAESTLTSYTLSAGAGTITLTGQAASLLYDRVVSAGNGTITLTGQDATLLRSYLVGAGAGTITLTGQDATLTYTDIAAQFNAAANAISSLSGTQESAIETLVARLKGTGTTNGSDLITTGKVRALWPFVGTTSAGVHALDLFGNFSLTHVNSPTFSDTGMQLNGTTQYSRTGFVPSAQLTNNDVSMFLYQKNNTSENAFHGAFSSTTQRFTLIPRAATSNVFVFRSGDLGSVVSSAETNAAGSSIGSRRSSTDSETYRNGTSISSTATANAGTLATIEVYIGARNNSSTADGFSSNEIRAFGIGEGLTDNEAKDLSDALEDYNDALSRGVVA